MTTIDQLENMIIEKDVNIFHKVFNGMNIFNISSNTIYHIQHKCNKFSLSNKPLILYFIFYLNIKNSIEIKIEDEIKHVDFVDADEILSYIKVKDENYDTLLKYFMSLWFVNISKHLGKILLGIEYLSNKNISLDFIGDLNLIFLLDYLDKHQIPLIIEKIKDVNEITNIGISDVDKILSRHNVLDRFIEKGLDLDRTYFHNLKLISLFLLMNNVDMLKKIIDLTSLPLDKINVSIINDIFNCLEISSNLTHSLELMSSLENFDDFIKTNYFVLMKISDEKTMKYINSLI